MGASGPSTSGASRADGDQFGLRPPDEFRIEEEHPDERVVVLALHGDADLHIAGELKDRLGEAIDDGASAVVLDLSGATFLDSMALGILLGAMKRLRARGGRFRVVAPRAEIRRIFEMTLLDRVFELDVSRQDALSAALGTRAAPAGS
jgi:anti-sigma B factor antagonist